MSKEIDYEDIEFIKSYEVHLKLENGDYVIINPFAIIEEMIEDKVTETGTMMDFINDIGYLQERISDEIDND